MKTENEMYQQLRQILEQGDFARACELVSNQKKSEWQKWADYLVHHSPIPVVVYVGLYQTEPYDKSNGFVPLAHRPMTRLECVKCFKVSQVEENPFLRMGVLPFTYGVLSMSEGLKMAVWNHPQPDYTKRGLTSPMTLNVHSAYYIEGDAQVEQILQENREALDKIKKGGDRHKISSLLENEYTEEISLVESGDKVQLFY